jgi:hypothetical protein
MPARTDPVIATIAGTLCSTSARPVSRSPEVGVDEVNPEQVTLDAVDAHTALRGDPVRRDPEPCAQRTDELETLPFRRIEHDSAVRRDAPVGREVSGQPAEEVRAGFVKARYLLEEPWKVVHQNVLARRTRHAVGEPLEHGFVLRRTNQGHRTSAVPRPVAEREPVRDTEWRECRASSQVARIGEGEAIAALQVLREDFTAARSILAGAHEPSVFVGGVDLLHLTVAGEGDLHQGLHAVRLEGRVDPIGPRTEDSVGPSSELADGADAVVRQHLGLTSQAVVHPPGRSHVEARRLLVVEGAESLVVAPAGALERDVRRDHVVDARLLAHLRNVLVPDPAGHGVILRPGSDAERACRD